MSAKYLVSEVEGTKVVTASFVGVCIYSSLWKVTLSIELGD